MSHCASDGIDSHCETRVFPAVAQNVLPNAGKQGSPAKAAGQAAKEFKAGAAAAGGTEGLCIQSVTRITAGCHQHD